MQYPGQYHQCDDDPFWGSVVICTVCVAIVQNLVFILVLCVCLGQRQGVGW